MILGRYHDIIHDITISTFDSDGPPYRHSNFNDMSCKTLFLYILATDEENITLSGAYIDDILTYYNPESLCSSVSQLRVR